MAPETLKILLVEDNPGDARLVREYLRDAGVFQADLANAERLSEAQRMLETDRFDVVLLDLSLPDSRGLDTIVGAVTHARGVPIVVLTGLNDEELAVRAVREGAQDYLLKGRMDGSSVSRAIRYAIERARREKAEVLQKARTTHLWKSMFRILGPGAPAVLYRAGFDAGSTTFDFVMETWKPPDDGSFVRAVREHLYSAGLGDVRTLRLQRQAQRAVATVYDSFESGQHGPSAPTPVCHFLRGLFSGLINRVTEIPEVVCDELKCQAKGDPACEFAIHPMLG